MNTSLPLPHFEAKGLEDGNRQHHESATDNADADSFFMPIVHTASKGTYFKPVGGINLVRT